MVRPLHAPIAPNSQIFLQKCNGNRLENLSKLSLRMNNFQKILDNFELPQKNIYFSHLHAQSFKFKFRLIVFVTKKLVVSF